MMSDLKAIGLAVLIAGFGATYYATDATQAHETGDGNVCVITSETSRGTLTLTGIINGKTGQTGDYRFTVKGGGAGGTTSTSQGGAFEIDGSGKAETGRIVLGSDGVYDARLQFKLDGETHECSTRIGDRI